jgi:hypothetical protein
VKKREQGKEQEREREDARWRTKAEKTRKQKRNENHDHENNESKDLYLFSSRRMRRGHACALGRDHDREYAGMERESWGNREGKIRKEKITNERTTRMT